MTSKLIKKLQNELVKKSSQSIAIHKNGYMKNAVIHRGCYGLLYFLFLFIYNLFLYLFLYFICSS